MTDIVHDEIDALSTATGGDWPAIRKARTNAIDAKQRLSADVAELVSREDMSVVVFGSLPATSSLRGVT